MRKQARSEHAPRGRLRNMHALTVVCAGTSELGLESNRVTLLICIAPYSRTLVGMDVWSRWCSILIAFPSARRGTGARKAATLQGRTVLVQPLDTCFRCACKDTRNAPSDSAGLKPTPTPPATAAACGDHDRCPFLVTPVLPRSRASAARPNRPSLRSTHQTPLRLIPNAQPLCSRHEQRCRVRGMLGLGWLAAYGALDCTARTETSRPALPMAAPGRGVAHDLEPPQPSSSAVESTCLASFWGGRSCGRDQEDTDSFKFAW